MYPAKANQMDIQAVCIPLDKKKRIYKQYKQLSMLYRTKDNKETKLKSKLLKR